MLGMTLFWEVFVLSSMGVWAGLLATFVIRPRFRSASSPSWSGSVSSYSQSRSRLRSSCNTSGVLAMTHSEIDQLKNRIRKLRFEHGEITQRNCESRRRSAPDNRRTRSGKVCSVVVACVPAAAAFGVKTEDVFQWKANDGCSRLSAWIFCRTSVQGDGGF